MLSSWKAIAKGADFQCGKADEFDPNGASFLRAKTCMNYVDIGLRLNGLIGTKPYEYKAFVHSMIPLSCSPKNNILVGLLNIRTDMCHFLPIAQKNSGITNNNFLPFQSKVWQERKNIIIVFIQ